MPQVKFNRDSSDRLYCDVYESSSSDYGTLCVAIRDRFHLIQTKPQVVGLDVLFSEYKGCDGVIELAWDIWSGFIVIAKDPSAEPLVREIAAFLYENDAGKN